MSDGHVGLENLNVGAMDISISALQRCYQAGEFTPAQFIRRLHQHVLTQLDGKIAPVWIYFLSAKELESYLARLEHMPKDLPLYGIPFGIKDNIDLAGVPTTAACAEFAYTPSKSATVVQRLLDAGAIPFGKTNLDQFATGLVGVRSPYGICQNALNEKYISGGSSSGSAIALAKGWVSFTLGTDTAGSGRVPAALNDLVGLKPSRGIFSNTGMVPACRSLDCISVFTKNVEDANKVFDLACAYDPTDPYSRKNPFHNGPRFGGCVSPPLTIGLPHQDQLNFFKDEEAKALFDDAVETLRTAGVTIKEIDFQPFMEAAKLLYEGPWVAERFLATQSILQGQPDAILPVTRAIIASGEHLTAASAFRAQYKLQACAQRANEILDGVDCVITPTIGTAYTIEQVLADPVNLNSNLGYYTNFMNLLDCAALALPTGFQASGVGVGITLFQKALSDKILIGIGRFVESVFSSHQPTPLAKQAAAYSTLDIVVCGAHLQGLPLNWQLTERGGVLVNATQTSPNYRLYALPGGPPQRPGMIRVTEDGKAIDVEVWRLPLREFGGFVAQIPAPLAIGKVQLVTGNWLTGFVCEGIAQKGAVDITALGGWRQYLAQ